MMRLWGYERVLDDHEHAFRLTKMRGHGLPGLVRDQLDFSIAGKGAPNRWDFGIEDRSPACSIIAGMDARWLEQ